MTPHYSDDSVTLYHGDCLEVLAELPDASVDSVVTDPPYGLEFMGREWDGADGFRRSLNAADAGRDNAFGRTSRTSPEYRAGTTFQEWCERWAVECLRVLKPGGHMLAFGGSRTWHRLAVAVEDAGFEIRDSIAWLYGSGFPKSLDVSKAIDKGGHLSRPRALEFTAWMRSTGITAAQINEATGTQMGSHYLTDKTQPEVATADAFDLLRPLLPEVPERIERLVAERTGIEWTDYIKREVIQERTMTQGGGTSLQLRMGEAREVRADITAPATPDAERWRGWGTALKPAFEPIVVGRKPLAGTVAANVLTHGTGALNIDGCRVGAASGLQRPERRGRGDTGGWANYTQEPGQYGTPDGSGRWPTNVVLDESQAAELDEQSGTTVSRVGKPRGAAHGDGWGMTATGAEYDDQGGASRFFPTFRYEAKAPTEERPRVGGIAHPTVKPLDLMRWLVRLVTPPGGTVLEPFAGSGTTAEACVLERFQCIAIEREADYLPLIAQRLSKPMEMQLDLEGLTA